jgi:hypothetical protein
MNYWAERQLSKAINKLNDELRESIKTGLESIQKFFEDASTQHISAMRDGSKTTNETLNEIQTHLAKLTIRVHERAEAKILRKKEHRQQIWLTWGTWLAFGAAAIYAGIAANQMSIMDSTYREVQKQTVAAQCAAKAAQEAVRQAHDQFVQDQRPYMAQTANSTQGPKFFDNPMKPGSGAITWDWHMSNYGKTPAYDVSYAEEINIGSGFVHSAGKFRTVLAGVIVPNFDTFHTIVSEPMSKERFDELMKTDEGIAIRIVIKYRDSYRTPYETGLCFSHLALNAVEVNCRKGNGNGYNYIK